jgi:acetyl/propionyl-CoA carboxylase alpha subunit
MEYHEMITSPCYGVIKNISIEKHSRIYEWEPLFLIQTRSGEIETIKVGLSGKVQSLEVQKGDKVIPGMVLAYVKEDTMVTGSD